MLIFTDRTGVPLTDTVLPVIAVGKTAAGKTYDSRGNVFYPFKYFSPYSVYRIRRHERTAIYP